MQISRGGHQFVKFDRLGEIGHEETVLCIEKNEIGALRRI